MEAGMRDQHIYIQPASNQCQHDRRAVIGVLLLALSIVVQLVAQHVLI
jgi:hypothetical protein